MIDSNMDILAKLADSQHSPKQPYSIDRKPAALIPWRWLGYRPGPDERTGTLTDLLLFSHSYVVRLDIPAEEDCWLHFYKCGYEPRLGDEMTFSEPSELGMRHGLPYLHVDEDRFFLSRQAQAAQL